MKKLFSLTVIAIFAMVLVGCDDTIINIPEVQPEFTIINESSYVLTGVTFSGVPFASPGSSDLLISGQAVRTLESNAQGGYINFTRKDIGIALRTTDFISLDANSFLFNDNTGVMEVANPGNVRTLGTISFLSQVTLEYGGLTVAKNGPVNLGEAVINNTKQNDFVLKNTGVGKLLLSGTEPVKISGDADAVFSVAQPSSSEIASNSSLPFRINFNPKSEQVYTATVTISSNDQSGDFIFNITATGALPKPIATVLYENVEIAQNGTINAGDVLITQSKNITVVIKNTGTTVLTVDTAGVVITGADAAVFTQLTNPGSNISPNAESSFIIEYKPVNQGGNNAILTIPTNDGSRNPVVVFLTGTGLQGAAILELSQAGTVIDNNSITPFDFGQVELGTNKPLVFTIKNTGTIPLELTGTPIVESSNSIFTILTQPAVTTINPGADVSFSMRYMPTAEIEDTSTITITNSSNATLFTFSVKGTGFERKPQVFIRQGVSNINQHGEYNYGTLAAGKTSEITFTIGNSGEANLTFEAVNGQVINLADNDAGLFTVIQQPSTTTVVTPGSTTTFAIRFSPAAVGNSFFATVQIKTNSHNNDEFSFRVTGNARAANSEARLNEMQFSTGTLSPAFNSNIYIYDLRIQTGATLVNVRPTSVDANVTSIRVNGVVQASGVLSQDIILATTNTITIVVTAEDGITTATYTLNIKIINTWERLHGASGQRYGIFRAISNGEGGLYAGGYAGNNTAALFNIDQNGQLLNTFNFTSHTGTIGAVGIGMGYNDYFSVYQASNEKDYYITKATSPAINPTPIMTSLNYNGHDLLMYPAGIVRSTYGQYFVAGNANYAATTNATEYTFGVFINRHLNNGTWDTGMVTALNITGITAGTYVVYGMTLLSNGDVLIYGEANRAGLTVAFAAAINASAANANEWTVRWSNTYEIAGKTSGFYYHFYDASSNILLIGGSDDGGFVVKFPGNATTAAAAKPAGWPKIISGEGSVFDAGLAINDGSGYLFVGSSTGPYGGGDVWIVKTDLEVNTKTWEKFYGGTGDEWALAVIEQADSFILGGGTRSPSIAGQNRTGTEDIYILKINKDGTMD